MSVEMKKDDESRQRLWAGYGEEKPCHRCSKPIEQGQVQFELVSGASNPDAALLFHLDCYDQWIKSKQPAAK